jgi:glycosyltransferase involved in cell wall biosynthesis
MSSRYLIRTPQGGRTKGRLRVAIIAPPYIELPPRAYGAVENVCSLLADSLIDRGHEVVVIGAGQSNLKAEFIAARERIQGPRWHELMPDLIHAAAVAKILEELHVDVIHDHTTAGPLVTSRSPIPSVVTVHSPIHSDRFEFYDHLGDSTGLVAISSSQRLQAPKLNWIGTVHNGIRATEFPYRQEKDDYILFLGRCTEDKGVHLAIDAAREAGIKILLAATTSLPRHRTYFHEMVEPRLGAGAVWLGEVDSEQKKELLSGARCLAFPVLWEEPFGMVMIEALACGTPVVALRRGAVQEVIVDGETGFICDHPSELPKALASVEKLSPQRCRQDCEIRFNTDLMAVKYEALYRSVIDRSWPPNIRNAASSETEELLEKRSDSGVLM